MNHLKAQSGIAAILTVIIISAAGLILAVGAAWLSLNELDMAFVNGKQNETRAIAEGCAEEILRQIQMDNSFVSNNFSLSLGDGSCAAAVSADGDSRTIDIAAELGDYRKRLNIALELVGGRISVNSWADPGN